MSYFVLIFRDIRCIIIDVFIDLWRIKPYEKEHVMGKIFDMIGNAHKQNFLEQSEFERKNIGNGFKAAL